MVCYNQNQAGNQNKNGKPRNIYCLAGLDQQFTVLECFIGWKIS